MRDRGNEAETKTPADDELREIEAELRRLSLRVTAIVNDRANSTTPSGRPAATAPRTANAPRTLVVGDRVRFKVKGEGLVDGTVVGRTTHRVRIQRDGSTATALRAPANVILVDSSGRSLPYTTA